MKFLVQGFEIDSEFIKAAGWGPITADKEPNTVLRFSRVNTVISFSTGTTTTISPAGNLNTFECPNTATTLCTWNTTCTTDVGGPLVTPAGLIGVASTTDCGAMVNPLYNLFYLAFNGSKIYFLLRTHI